MSQNILLNQHLLKQKVKFVSLFCSTGNSREDENEYYLTSIEKSQYFKL